MRATLFSILFADAGRPFAAAQKLGRMWIGIDVAHLAVGLMKLRLKDSFWMVAGRSADTPVRIGGSSAESSSAPERVSPPDTTSERRSGVHADKSVRAPTYRVIGAAMRSFFSCILTCQSRSG